MKKKIAEKSRQEGYRRSRLPEFTKEEVEYIRGKRYQSHLESRLYLNFSHYFTETPTGEISPNISKRPSNCKGEK